MQNFTPGLLKIGLLTQIFESTFIEDPISKAILKFHSTQLSHFTSLPQEKQKCVYQAEESSSLGDILPYWEMREEYMLCATIRDLILEKGRI